MHDKTPNKLDHARRSGSGGAHMRWSMFGARGPLLNSEPSGAAGGGQSPAPAPSPTSTLFAPPAAPAAPAPAPTPTPAPSAATPQANGNEQPFNAAQMAALRTVVRDAMNADSRRGGQPPPKKQTEAPSRPASPAALDLSRLRELDRAIARSGANPDNAAYKRIERDFAAESPEDADAWLASYFGGLGIKPPQVQQQPQPAAPAAPAPAPTTTAPAVPARQPVTNLGSPPAPQVPLEQQDLLSMTAGDRAEIIRQKGPAWFAKTLLEQQKGRKVKFGG